jgi:catechol 2,3-dioxygenase-like lactoylglutathione lyase family enzyme
MPGPIDQQVTFLATRDLAATAAFYEQVLGLPLALDQGVCRIYRVTAEAFVGFCQSMEAPERPGNSVTLTLVSDDVDGWAARLRQLGVPIEKEPQLNPKFSIYHCFIRDPNGYLIEVQRFEDPRWPSAR